MYKIIIASIVDYFDKRMVVLGIATSSDDIEEIVNEAKKKYDRVVVKKIIEVDSLNKFIPRSVKSRIE